MASGLNRRKRKLLVILGAGTSIPCEMPSVTEIDRRMEEWSRSWTYPVTFPQGTAGNGIFNDLWRFLETYNARKPQPQLGPRLNFERVLGEMISLASWMTPPPFGNALQEAVRDGLPSNSFTWPSHDERDYYYRNLIIEQLSSLLKNLASFMRKRCAVFESALPSFELYRGILNDLTVEFDVGIYNLNYDDLAVRSWPEGFTGFPNGHFDACAVASRQEWDFIYHLHGNVHYSLNGPPMEHSVEWKDDLNGTFDDSRVLEPNLASGFIPIIPSTLIAGGYKLDQLLADPSQSIYAALVRHVHQADAVLVAGYGFGDVHVNRALRNRFKRSSIGPNGRPPVVLLTKTTLPGPLIADRQGHEFFAWEMTHTFKTTFPISSGTPGAQFSLPELLNQNEFEHDYSQRVAVWHGGFTEVRDHMSRVVDLLNS